MLKIFSFFEICLPPFKCNNSLRLHCRFIQYKPTSLEKNYKHELLTESDLDVTIDLINPETYDINPNS